MPRNVLDRAPGDRVRVLDPDGEIADPVLFPDLEDETLASMYRDMRFCRRFDDRMISHQWQGRTGTYPSLAGREGTQVGSTYALAADDLVSFQYREHGAVVARDLPREHPLYWMGHEAGNAALADLDVFPLDVSIGSHLPQAVGWAWAARLAGDDRAAAVHFGDGVTSEGDFHEGLNFAGVFDVPAVFVCTNNQWATSVPRERQTASDTIAQKADAYGFEGVQVDGMDPLAVYAVTAAAREKAVDPGEAESRPTLIETVQCRSGVPTTAADASVYRDEADVERWKTEDPIDRLEAFLLDCGILDDERIESIEADIESSLDGIVDRAERVEADPDESFSHVYAEPTPRVAAGRESLRRLREDHGDATLLEDR